MTPQKPGSWSCPAISSIERAIYNDFGGHRVPMSRNGWVILTLWSAIGVFIASTMTYYHYSVSERRERVQKLFPFIQRLYAVHDEAAEPPFGPPPSGTFTDPGSIRSSSEPSSSARPNLPFCDVSGRLSCAKVDESPYSVFLGIPVPLLGLLGFLQFLLISGAGVIRPCLTLFARRYFVVISVFALLFTGYLNAVEAFIIHAFCPWCIGSTVVTLGITLPALVKSRSLWVR
jgi:uncharacterized membrane protein